MDVSRGAFSSQASYRARFLAALWGWLLLCLGGLATFQGAAAQSSICAEVKIQINQRVSFERQAFDAMLRIRNGLEGIQVERIDVNLTFKDIDGVESSGKFFHRLDTTTGITGSVEDATGVVAASTTGEAHWLIIPTAGAGGTSGKDYQVGATVTYRMTGETSDRTVEVIPEVITVRPQPVLALDYFLPGYVYADDPLTPEAEPTIPFTLGVRISNTGYGVAAHTTIESAQPEIVENDQGLMIDFRIIGSYVDDQPAQPSLLIDFGDIAPGQSRMGRWLMTTTLSGQFFGFQAEYTHADDLGGELTSLIEAVTPHLLTRDVLMVRPGRDAVRDFLAQAIDAAETGTYRVYESDGAVSEVVQQFAPTFTGSVLSFPAQQGSPLYARTRIGFDGQGRAVSAVRIDTGRPVPPENVWFSKRRDSTGDGWEYFLNLFESDAACGGGTCTYDLTYDGAPSESSLAGVVYEDLNANGLRDAGEQGLAEVSVSLTGGDTPLTATTAADGSFAFTSLSAATYALTVGAVPDHYDGIATIGTAGGSSSGATISGIVLTSGTQASGYGFAKVPVVAQAEADLAIDRWVASTNSPRVNETFTLTLQVSNLGPDVADVDAGVALPSTLQVLSANASSGTFNSATGHWALGEVDPSTSGRDTLTLEVRATDEGTIALAASVSSVDASVLDPNAANNSASVSLDVQAATSVRVTPSFARESRILVLFGCARVISGPGPSQCDTDRGALESYLAARSVEYLIVQSAVDFRDELRSGRWNVHWIHNGAASIDQSVREEVGLAVLRGDSLIVDGAHDAGSATLDAWIGATRTGLRPQAAPEAITFVPNDDLDFAGLTVSGNRQAYQVTTGTMLAKYPDNGPAIVLGLYGEGRAWLFTYDLANSLSGNNVYVPFFEQIATATRPPIPENFTTDAYVPVDLKLENLGGSVEVDETFSVPSGARILRAQPAPTQDGTQQVTWRKDLAVSETFDARVGLRTPNIGVSSVAVDVKEAGTPGPSLAHQEFALGVIVTGKRIAILESAISSLEVSDTTDILSRDEALASVESADSARADGQLTDALSHLLNANASLTQIAGVDTTELRIGLARLLQAVEREWYLALSTCSSVTEPPVSDPGFSFVPFAANEGVSMHEIRPGGFDWRLGADTGTAGAYAGIVQNLTDDALYRWILSYDGSGNGTLSLQSGTTLVNSVTYTAPANRLLHLGNGLRLSIEALSGGGEKSIAVEMLDLEGTLFTDVINATSTATTANASLYYYGNALRNGFQAVGTIKVKRPRLVESNPPSRLSFLVNAGSLSCKYPER
jgi:hypothetical protein